MHFIKPLQKRITLKAEEIIQREISLLSEASD